MSRQLTEEEVRLKLLQHIWGMIDYWKKDDRTLSVAGKLEGLAFSILVALDGGAGELPRFLVAASPHADDEAFHREEGTDWFPPLTLAAHTEVTDIAGCLHEEFHDVGRKMGLLHE